MHRGNHPSHSDLPLNFKLQPSETIATAARQNRGMNLDAPSRREILDQDLQIVRVTLAAISPDVRGFSGPAADAIEEALERLDSAREAFGAGDRL